MATAHRETAREIAETLLDITGRALLDRDFDSLLPCFHLPHLVETCDLKAVLRTPADLRAVFDRVTADHARNSVTTLVRICEVAEFLGPTRIAATHVTHMMAGNRRVQDPVPSYAVLDLIEGSWRISASQYAVDEVTTVGRALSQPLPNTEIGAQDAPRA